MQHMSPSNTLRLHRWAMRRLKAGLSAPDIDRHEHQLIWRLVWPVERTLDGRWLKTWSDT